MEAPEKIYFSGQQQWSNRFFDLMQKRTDTDIEYTRTDAFIEKACKCLREGGNGWYLSSEFGEDEINFVKFAKDFKNYMKGE